MAPVKFEENIRERLEQRELKPSVAAWERIEHELDASAKRKSKKGYTAWLVAAGFIGILILAGKFLLPSTETLENPVVNVPVEEHKQQILPQDELLPLENEKLVESTPVTVPKEQAQKTASQKDFVETPETNQEAVVVQENTVESLEEPVQQKVDAEVEKLLNTVTQQQNTRIAYSDAEIDRLLRDAQRDILSEQIFDKNQNRVSADALLYEVEEELDPSFKDRIFEALKDGFLKAREAVASRNN